MKHDSTIQLCRRRAEAQLALADFIDSRCEPFECVCAHESDGKGAPSLHVYELDKAVELFGPDGWEPCDYNPSNAVQKLVDGIMVSAERTHSSYVVPPTVP